MYVYICIFEWTYVLKDVLIHLFHKAKISYILKRREYMTTLPPILVLPLLICAHHNINHHMPNDQDKFLKDWIEEARLCETWSRQQGNDETWSLCSDCKILSPRRRFVSQTMSIVSWSGSTPCKQSRTVLFSERFQVLCSACELSYDHARTR
jgi:hypothetical protein